MNKFQRKVLYNNTNVSRVGLRGVTKSRKFKWLVKVGASKDRTPLVKKQPIIVCIHHNHHWAAVVSRGWAKASACRLQVSLFCAVLCPIVSLQCLSRSSLHRLAGLPCRLFLSYGLQVVTRVVHRSSLRRLICPAQDHFIFLTLLIISMAFVFSLTQMLVSLSLYVTRRVPV